MKDRSLGSLIDELDLIRSNRRYLAERDKELSAGYAALEAEIKERLGAEGMARATGRRATVSLNSVIIANVTDWTAVYALIKKTGSFHLLQRRISDPAFRELYELELNKLSRKRGFDPEKLDPATVLPGFVPFTKVNLNLTSLKAAA